jgi:hypothetical protein
MTFFRRALLVLPLVSSLGLLGCGTPGPGDGGTGGGSGNGDCFDEFDCPDPQLFFCNTTTSKCEPACRTKTDCTASARGQYALEFCNGTLGCQCDEGKCVGSLCSSDTDCGTQVCRNGACVADPGVSAVAKCSITPDYQVIPAGGKAKFYVSAWDSANKPVVVKAGATWSSNDSSIATVTGSGNSAEATAGTTPGTAPVAGVKAAFGSTSCTAQTLVVPATAPAATVLAVVTDELTGRPISGATVIVSDGTGAVLGTGTTLAAGSYAVAGVAAGGNVSVSVFHTDYNYLTIANYPMSGSRVLSMPLRRNQTDKFGGYKGTFNNVPQTSNIHAGIASMSLAGSITDLSLAQLLGPSEPTDIVIGSAINQMDVPIPAGVYLGFTDSLIKGNVSALGLAGTCSDASKVTAGTCGTRSAWALAGDVPLGDLPIDAFAGGTSNIDFGKVLSRIIPIFKKFNSSVERDVEFSLKPTPCTGGTPSGAPCPTGDYDFKDTSSFTATNHVFDQIPLAFNFAVNVPNLPKFKGTPADGAVVLGGANVIGRGVVPLGMGVGVNTNPVDDKVDTQAELPSAGLISMRMAPTHHGLEGAEYGIVTLALSLKSITDASAGIATSAIYGRVSGNQLKFDPKGATPVSLGSDFLSFPEGAKYNFTSSAQPGLPARTFKLALPTGVTLSNVTMIRVAFTDQLEHRWVVYASLAEATAATGLTLPAPPGTFTDRTFHTGVSTGTRSTMLAQAIRLNDNPTGSGSQISFQQLVELNNTNYDRITEFTTGFSFIDYARPEVAWNTPSTAGTTVMKSGSVKVDVTGFKVGATAAEDGFVRLTFPGSANCADIDTKTDASAGKGEITISLSTLGASCTGSVTMKAILYDNQGTPQPIAPEVSASITATLQ